MMYKSITFDERNVNWTNSKEENLMFLRYSEYHIRDLLSSRGYMYLNQICEFLGDGWDPDCYNHCFRHNDLRKDKIWFEFKPLGRVSYVVHIMCDN